MPELHDMADTLAVIEHDGLGRLRQRFEQLPLAAFGVHAHDPLHQLAPAGLPVDLGCHVTSDTGIPNAEGAEVTQRTQRHS